MTRRCIEVALVLIAVLCPACERSGELAEQDVGQDSVVGRAPAADTADQGSATAAVAVIDDYYAAIATRDYARAYAHWSGEGKASDQTFDEFRSGFAETAQVTVQTGLPGRIEPAAGSRYIQVPITIRAQTSNGSSQCFDGSYTLRRSEVTGATEEQRRWHITSAEILERGCDPPAADSVRALVGIFGNRLAQVSTLASPEAVRRALQAHYAELVTPPLLRSWLDNPAGAPGRTVSSPAPARIEIRSLQRLSDVRYRVSGHVLYVTSVQSTIGGVAERRPVTLEVIRDGGRWKIDSFTS